MNNNKATSSNLLIIVIIPILFGVFCAFLLGLFICGISIVSFIHGINFIETTATIVDVKQNGHSDTYYPIYEFEVEGKKYEQKDFRQVVKI